MLQPKVAHQSAERVAHTSTDSDNDSIDDLFAKNVIFQCFIRIFYYTVLSYPEIGLGFFQMH